MSAQPAHERIPRRRLLLAAGGAIAAGAVSGTARTLFSAGGEALPSVGELASQVQGYRRYYVVPAALDKFSEQRRRELDVLGPQLAALSCKNEQCRAPGFMAWLNPVAANQVAAQQDVREVYELTPDDVQVMGGPKDSKGQLFVTIAPNGWGVEPKAGTFLKANELAEAWQQELKEYAPATVTGEVPQLPAGVPQQKVGVQAYHVSVRVQFENPEVPEKAIQIIKSHPQTIQMVWMGVVHEIQPLVGDGCPGCGLG